VCRRTTPSRWLDVDAVEQVVERPLVDRAGDIALDRWRGDLEGPSIESLVTRSRMQLIPLLRRALCA
jgi:hypothetical protein